MAGPTARRPPYGAIRTLRPGLAAHALGFAAGVIALHLQPHLPAAWPAAAAALLLAGVARRLPVLGPLALACAGFAWAALHACLTLCDPFPAQLTRETLELTGRVVDLPGRSQDAQRFLFQVETSDRQGADAAFAGLVRLSWYRNPPRLRAGERWRLTVRLKPPHGFANPGGFDFERWLFQEGIRATGYVLASDHNRRLDEGPGPDRIDRWRQDLGDHIDQVLAGRPGAGLVRALVLGDRSGLSPADWEVLTRTGTNHLIAISGLHVGLVAGFVFFVARWLWSRSARLALALAAPRAGAIAAFAAALGYSALAGFAVSTQRALIMIAVVLVALAWARTVRPAAGLAAALVGVLALEPKAVLSAGFWLSFGAVAVLLFALGRRLPGGGWWTRWGRAQWAVGLGLLPMLFLLFGRASLIAPAVNLIAVPVFSLVLLPAVLIATLLSLVPGLGPVLTPVGEVLGWGLALLEMAAAWSWSAASIPAGPLWVWCAAFAGAALLLAPQGLPGRWGGVPLLLPLLLVRPPGPAQGEAELTLLDVGQGLSAVVRTRGHLLLYDTGPSFPSGFNAGSAVVLPFLREIGVGRIDTLILSHADRDHAGGFQGLAGKLPIGRLLSGEPGELPGDSGAAPCLAGDRWIWDGVRFELLHPNHAGFAGNDSSCVVRVVTGGGSLLLPGDAEGGVERMLAASMPDALAATLLVAGHHGSATSSTGELLAAVAPRFVLYSSGFANHFGFPAAAVRERVQALGAVQLDTAETGAIGFRLNDQGVEGPTLYRREVRRLWTHRVADAPF